MAKVATIDSVVKRKEKAIVIFTRGGNTKLSHLGASSTGDWKINENREFDTVIIYHRDDTTETNTIFKGSYVNRKPGKETGRVKVIMDNVKNVGTTDSNWPAFNNKKTGTNPISYFSK